MTIEKPPPLEERWIEEKTSAWLYHKVAAAEPDKRKQSLFLGLAKETEAQADILAREMGGTPGKFTPPLRAKIVAVLVGVFTPARTLTILRAMKVRGLSAYAGAYVPRGHKLPVRALEPEKRHRAAGGGTLRAGVFGVNDGLVSNTCLIMGVAGATEDSGLILITGLAGLLAGAFSMAAGEYVSVRSQREMFEHQIAQERDEISRYPNAEARELALIYEARGVAKKESRRIATEILKDPDQALDVLAREELGLNPDDLGSPWGAAISSFTAFVIGASLPLIPYLFEFTSYGFYPSAAIAGVALFGVGSAISLFSGKGALRGGLRMLMIGAAAAFATFQIGTLLGVGLS